MMINKSPSRLKELRLSRGIKRDLNENTSCKDDVFLKKYPPGSVIMVDPAFDNTHLIKAIQERDLKEVDGILQFRKLVALGNSRGEQKYKIGFHQGMGLYSVEEQ